MTEKKENALNEEYDAKMTRKYESKIIYGNLKIIIDPEVTNLRFLEKFDISTLNLYISSDISVKLRSKTLKELTVSNFRDDDDVQQQRLNVDDLELENLEVLDLENNKLVNDQLYNLAKFKKLHSLNVSENKVDLTHIHSATNLTKLSMQRCGLKNIDQISWLINLKEIDFSLNRDMDLYYQVNYAKLKVQQNQLCDTAVQQILIKSHSQLIQKFLTWLLIICQLSIRQVHWQIQKTQIQVKTIILTIILTQLPQRTQLASQNQI
ncbi:Leucine-rich_repeat domain superfamily [Hexamita inflata]|uniref:Leucine-rich repeat domain superfamily n=1 Tax=Hexamita inflata TaxID=28002 RepID=A0AA86UIM6_9EUKA|nr:Leucine-rich repeat domain superfamily [Hexamita inflata]